jgi:RHS repeat-associated protein
VITDPKGFATTSDLDPAWGLAVATTDQNARRTDLAYDGLGRLTSVWLPGRDKASQQPDQKFAYTINNAGGPTVVSSSRLNGAGTGYLTQFTLYDGWLRQRQHQAPAVGGGRLVDETRYDSRGLSTKERPAYFNENAPAGTLFQPTGDVAVPEQVVTSYDGAARPTAAITQVDAVEKWRTSTGYGGDHTDVTPPAGGTGTSTWTDARDQVTAIWQYHGNAASGAHDTTSRTYTLAGDLATVTDAAGNTWTATYDQRRRRSTVDDPNRGRTTYSYDSAGNITGRTDARNVTVVRDYDELGREKSERLGTATGPLLATHSYDSLPGGLGKLASSTSYDSAGNGYSSKVTGYTARYQPTGTTTVIPSAAGALAGSYSTTLTYNADGTLATAGEPVKDGAGFGGLPAETLRYGYNGLGMLTSMSGASSYVTDTQYLQTGQLSSVAQTDGTKTVIQYFSYEHGTNRLAQHQVVADIPTVIAAETNYTHDPAGNVTKVADTLAHQSAGPDDTQCLGYDYLGRVSEAWTPTSGDCTQAPSATALGGPAPYWTSFTVDPTGNRTRTVEHSSAGTSTTSYSYPTGTHVALPHSVSQTSATGLTIGTSTYRYDTAGNTTTRAVAGRPSQTLDWSPDGRLAAVTDSTGRTDYTYTAAGDRLLAKDPAGSTLYLGNTQCRASGSTVSCSRPYDYASAGTVGVRTPTGLSWQVADPQGTPAYSFRASDMAETQRRTTPFGAERGGSPAWPSTAGFVNGVKDPTGLTHVGAREYDPALGRFASVDPVFTVDDSQSWHGYAYADNSPVTGSDPTGLRTEDHYYGPGGKDKDPGTTGGGQGSGGGGGGGGGNVHPPPSSGNWSGACDGHHSASNCDDSGNAKAPAPHKPKDIASKTTYHHGTVLIVYYDGTVTINGRRVPAGVKDPDALAQSLDLQRQSPDDGGPQGVLGFCLGGGLQAYFVAAFDYCLVGDKNGVALAVTDVTPKGGQGPGLGFGLHAHGLYSPNARTKDDLGGPFNYETISTPVADGTYASGPAADGHQVDVWQAGPSAGWGGGYSDGISNTDVTGYWWKWPSWLQHWP